jgi:hypothetical protein
MLKTLKNEKPWAILKVSRRQYETKRPWVAANMGSNPTKAPKVPQVHA